MKWSREVVCAVRGKGMALAGRAAVVTGGASGIGRATSLMLKKLGAAVMVGDRQKPPDADGMLYTPCDVADVGDMEGLLDEAVRKMGKMDIWVNNAGLELETQFKPFGKKAMDPANRAKLVTLINVNMLAMIDGTRIAVHHLKDSGHQGSVLNVSSLSAFIPMAAAPVYSATKAGISQYTRAVGRYLGADSPVRVHALCPGFTETPLVTTAPGTVEWIQETTGEQLMSADDVAAAAAELLGPAGSEGHNGKVVKMYMRGGAIDKAVFQFSGHFGGMP